MPSILKVICKVLKNPSKPIKHLDAKKILNNEGATLKGIEGSHHKYRYQDKIIVFQVHGKELHPHATKDLIDVLELREKYEKLCN